MGAPTKEGLSYFSFDVDLLDDDDFDFLRGKYGYVVNDVYIGLLTLLYRDKGYYIPYETDEDKEKCVWYLYKRMRGGKHSIQQESIPTVIEALVSRGKFSRSHFPKIITSARAQKTYYKATVERGIESFNIIPDYWMLDDETMRKLSKVHPYYKFLHPESKSDEEQNKSDDNQGKSDEKPIKKSTAKESNNGCLEKEEIITNNSAGACARNKEMFVRNADRGNINVDNLREWALVLHKTDKYVDIMLNALDELFVNVDNLSAHLLGEIASRVYKYNPTNPKAYIKAILETEGIIERK